MPKQNSLPLFTVIVPTFNHESTLKYSLQSIVDQTFKNFQVFVIGDGATKNTQKIVEKICSKDSRFIYHSFGKSPRTGEPYRHELIQKVATPYICYLSDDDLWFPEHLEVMKKLLSKSDFAYTFPLMINPGGAIKTWYGNLTQPFYKKLFLTPGNNRYNVIPLSCAGHTLKSYKKLSRGWETTPLGKHTDLHMWQMFIKNPNNKIAKHPEPTVVHLASSLRKNISKKERTQEIVNYYSIVNNPLKKTKLKNKMLVKALNNVYQDFLDFRIAVQSTKTWRIHDWIKKITG